MTDYLTVAERIAREAGAILREGYGQVQTIEHKGSIDLVTEFDRRSEALIVAALRTKYPAHTINAEESGQTAAAGD